MGGGRMESLTPFGPGSLMKVSLLRRGSCLARGLKRATNVANSSASFIALEGLLELRTMFQR